MMEMIARKNRVNDEGEGAPWKSTRLAPLTDSVLPGLPSTPGPPASVQEVSACIFDSVKPISGLFIFGSAGLKC